MIIVNTKSEMGSRIDMSLSWLKLGMFSVFGAHSVPLSITVVGEIKIADLRPEAGGDSRLVFLPLKPRPLESLKPKK